MHLHKSHHVRDQDEQLEVFPPSIAATGGAGCGGGAIVEDGTAAVV